MGGVFTSAEWSADEFQEFLPRQACVANQRPEEAPTQFAVPGYRKPTAGRSDQDHVASLHAVEHESDPGDPRNELVARDDGKARHYTCTVTT